MTTGVARHFFYACQIVEFKKNLIIFFKKSGKNQQFIDNRRVIGNYTDSS